MQVWFGYKGCRSCTMKSYVKNNKAQRKVEFIFFNIKIFSVRGIGRRHPTLKKRDLFYVYNNSDICKRAE